jgi:hypothetical protein
MTKNNPWCLYIRSYAQSFHKKLEYVRFSFAVLMQLRGADASMLNGCDGGRTTFVGSP